MATLAPSAKIRHQIYQRFKKIHPSNYKSANELFLCFTELKKENENDPDILRYMNKFHDRSWNQYIKLLYNEFKVQEQDTKEIQSIIKDKKRNTWSFLFGKYSSENETQTTNIRICSSPIVVDPSEALEPVNFIRKTVAPPLPVSESGPRMFVITYWSSTSDVSDVRLEQYKIGFYNPEKPWEEPFPGYFVGYNPGQSPSPVKIEKIPKIRKHVFTPGMNGCILYVIDVKRDVDYFWVYHYPNPIGHQNFKMFCDLNGQPICKCKVETEQHFCSHFEIVHPFRFEHYCEPGTEKKSEEQAKLLCEFSDAEKLTMEAHSIKSMLPNSMAFPQAFIFMVYKENSWWIGAQMQAVSDTYDITKPPNRVYYAKVRSTFMVLLSNPIEMSDKMRLTFQKSMHSIMQNLYTDSTLFKKTMYSLFESIVKPIWKKSGFEEEIENNERNAIEKRVGCDCNSFDHEKEKEKNCKRINLRPITVSNDWPDNVRKFCFILSVNYFRCFINEHFQMRMHIAGTDHTEYTTQFCKSLNFNKELVAWYLPVQEEITVNICVYKGTSNETLVEFLQPTYRDCLQRIHAMKTRKPLKYKIQHASTERLKKSAVLYMQRLLNDQDINF